MIRTTSSSINPPSARLQQRGKYARGGARWFAAALVLAACGGGSEAGDGTDTAPTAAPATAAPADSTTPPTDDPRTGRKQAADCTGSTPEFDDSDGDGWGYCTPDVAPAATTPPPAPGMPSGDPLFPGYPLIVDIGTIDDRVASWLADSVVDGQVVALAPGVYSPYNPNVTDLLVYIDGPSDGDCVMREQFFPGTGGSCWNGVQKGSAEP